MRIKKKITNYIPNYVWYANYWWNNLYARYSLLFLNIINLNYVHSVVKDCCLSVAVNANCTQPCAIGCKSINALLEWAFRSCEYGYNTMLFVPYYNWYLLYASIQRLLLQHLNVFVMCIWFITNKTGHLWYSNIFLRVKISSRLLLTATMTVYYWRNGLQRLCLIA